MTDPFNAVVAPLIYARVWIREAVAAIKNEVK